ncbi:NUDIX hydrolase [Nocardia sp. NBC_01503]|uniref:NUDIX hydrolase n=1 Tax=Nocardia sp. NBC_01503 TaxID=2975997 RepID=UPI002E7BDB2A|nr:NUDIX hydrolase [Nocardia sp. NBC_01503]WTL32617.1 NUDIX hydrolase [Nocardia sp. NBC_01503]
METITSREIYSNRWITLREDVIRHDNGESGIYAHIDKSDFAIIVPFDGARFHLVEQFRYPLRQRCWEFPGGSVPGAREFDPIEVAQQELREETGLRAAELTYLGKLAAAPATSNHYGHVVLATDLTEGEPERESTEQDMRAAWFTRAELESMIADGVIVDSHSVAAYMLLLLHERTD